ncbi:MAG: alpha/beta hydrolase family protein [Candidatus Freyarchaeota archaeon]
MNTKISGLIIIAIIGIFILPPMVGAPFNSMNLAIITNILPTNTNNNMDNNNKIVQQQSETIPQVTVKAINSGIQNQSKKPPSETYDTSLLRQTQTTTPKDYRLTTETQKAQQDQKKQDQNRVITLSETILEENFTVTTWDGLPLEAYLWTKYPNQNKPLVVLVHGVGCDRNLWPRVFSAMWNELLDRGFTLVAYTQRYMGEWVPNFAYLIKDLRDVIYKAIELYDQHIDENNIGLVGHSLGSYVVTMAACADISYLLGDFYDKIKVVVEGNGPDNLIEAADWIRVNSILDPKSPIRVWAENNWNSICAAEQPIGLNKLTNYYGHPWCVAAWSGSDHVDTIYKPFWVFHDQWDSTIPPDQNAYPLFEDSRYNGIHWWHCMWILCWWDYTVVTANWNVGWLIVSDCGPHVVWLSNSAVTAALNVIDTYL